jgi:photosynthetic reaction center H subunit
MGTGAITAYVDVAQLVLYLFWIFFFGLIYYLIRENHREGYPMDNDRGLLIEGWPRVSEPKTYKLVDGREIVVPRPNDGPPAALNADRLYRGAGSPIEPNGNPLLAGVGPGSWSPVRSDIVDLDHHGEPKLVPLSLAAGYGVSSKDPDPRGMPVTDVYGDVAGTVRDLWLDRGEMLFRYLDVDVPLASGGTRRVLTPMPFARITDSGVTVHALLAAQFADVPSLRHTDRITLAEEERITAYYGAGTLYAEPQRAEPLV